MFSFFYFIFIYSKPCTEMLHHRIFQWWYSSLYFPPSFSVGFCAFDFFVYMTTQFMAVLLVIILPAKTTVPITKHGQRFELAFNSHDILWYFKHPTSTAHYSSLHSLSIIANVCAHCNKPFQKYSLMECIPRWQFFQNHFQQPHNLKRKKREEELLYTNQVQELF